MEEKKKIDVVDHVKQRLVYLHELKKHRLPSYWKYRQEYACDNVATTNDDGYTNYHLNTGKAIADTKASEIFANTPKYDFVGIDKEGRMYKRLMEKAWEWIWKVSNTNKAVGEVIMSAMKYGSGFGLEVFVEEERKVREPIIKDGKLSFGESKTIPGYKGCKLIPLEWHNVYVAGNDVEGITEAAIISHMEKEEFMQRIGNVYDIDVDTLQTGRMYFVGEGLDTLSLPTTDRSKTSTDDKNTISVIQYYHKWLDQYIIIAGEKHINVLKDSEDGIMPLPDPHKEIPLVCYIDHTIDGDAYGRGEFDITSGTRRCIDDTRSLKVETIKMQGGIITIDPGSDFDETVERIGLKQFAHIEKDDLGFFQPSISTGSLDSLSKELHEDLIIETGVDHRGQLFGPNETAEKTKGKIDAQRKRVNKNIRDNAFTFYERLARLRMENIKTYYGTIDIPVKGMDIDDEGNSTPLGKGDWGIMKLSKKILEGKVMLLPIIDSIYGDNSKEQRQKWLDFYQLAINAKDENGKPLYPPHLLWSSAIGIMDDVVDIPELLGNNSIIDKELEKELQEQGISNLPPPVEGMAGPSPFQQSGKPIVLPSQAGE